MGDNMGKKIAGIILTIIGGMLTLMALIYLLVFGLIGAGMKVAAGSDDEFLQETTTVSCIGEITDTGDGTTISYEVDGALYEYHVSVKNSAFSDGTKVTVYYNETDPAACSVPELVQGTYNQLGNIFGGIGIGLTIVFGVLGIAGLVGGILLIRSSKKSHTPSV